jgi:Flp pilus assembly protein protease CpaA
MVSIAISLLLVLCCSVIIFKDIREHRIYNWHLLILLPLLAYKAQYLPLFTSVVAIIVIWALSIACNIGGGDAKLLSLLVTFQGQSFLTVRYFSLVLICSSLSLLVLLLHKRTLKGSLPLAPAILLPFIAIYLNI